jgi:hypothetical protein
MAQQQKFGGKKNLFILIQNLLKNHFLAYQAFRCYFFKICKIAKFYLKFHYVGKNIKEYYFYFIIVKSG